MDPDLNIDSKQYPFTIERTYPDRSEAFLNGEFRRLAELQYMLGYSMLIDRVDRGFRFSFKNTSERSEFLKKAYESDEGDYIFIGDLKKYTPDFIEAWASCVSEVMDFKGYESEVEIKGNAVVVRLQTMEAYLLILDAERSNYFARMAEFKLNSRFFAENDLRLN